MFSPAHQCRGSPASALAWGLCPGEGQPPKRASEALPSPQDLTFFGAQSGEIQKQRAALLNSEQSLVCSGRQSTAAQQDQATSNKCLAAVLQGGGLRSRCARACFLPQLLRGSGPRRVLAWFFLCTRVLASLCVLISCHSTSQTGLEPIPMASLSLS